MKYLVKAVFRPIANRHYTNKKVSAWLYAFGFIPSVLFCLFGAITVHPVFWIILTVLVLYGILDYMLFDAFVDKLGWKLLWRHFYSDEIHELTPEHQAMKRFETNPTKENYRALQNHLRNK